MRAAIAPSSAPTSSARRSQPALCPLERGQSRLFGPGRDFVIEPASFFERTAPGTRAENKQTHVPALKQEFDLVSRLHQMARLRNRRPVDRNATSRNKCLGKGAGFHHTRKEEPLVDALLRPALWLIFDRHGYFFS
jgi:hypothetical protein